MNKRVARENLFLLKKIFDEQGIKFRIGFGTLLGAVRDKNFVTNDKDIDLVIEKKYKPQVENLFFGFDWVYTIQKENYLTLKRKGVSIDLYFFSKRNVFDKIFKRYTCGYGFWCIYFKDCFFEKWETINFLGGEFDCIPRAWLNYSYGDYTVVKQERGSRSRTFTSKWLMKIRDLPRSFMSEHFESKLRLLYRSIFR